MMTIGMELSCKRFGTRYIVEEVDGDRAIARSARLGGRVMVFETPDGFYFRAVADNGRSGASLFASLEPVGARYGLRRLAWAV